MSIYSILYRKLYIELIPYSSLWS